MSFAFSPSSLRVFQAYNNKEPRPSPRRRRSARLQAKAQVKAEQQYLPNTTIHPLFARDRFDKNSFSEWYWLTYLGTVFPRSMIPMMVRHWRKRSANAAAFKPIVIDNDDADRPASSIEYVTKMLEKRFPIKGEFLEAVFQRVKLKKGCENITKKMVDRVLRGDARAMAAVIANVRKTGVRGVTKEILLNNFHHDVMTVAIERLKRGEEDDEGDEDEDDQCGARMEFRADEHYDRLLPALKLATRFLETSAGFFWKVMNGGRYVINGNGAEVIGDCDPPTIEQAEEVRKRINGVVEKIRFFFTFPDEPLRKCIASTRPCIPNPKRMEEVRQRWCGIFEKHGEKAEIHSDLKDPFDEQNWQLLIRFGKKITTFFLQPTAAQWASEKYVSAAAKRGTWFVLAVVIVHEFAHAYGTAVRIQCNDFQPGRISGLLPEPFFDTEQAKTYTQSELGIAWEKWYFGGRILRIRTSGEPFDQVGSREQFGVCWSELWDDVEREGFRCIVDHDSAYWAVTDSSLNSVFDDESWGDAAQTTEGRRDDRLPQIELMPMRALRPITEDHERYDDAWERAAGE